MQVPLKTLVPDFPSVPCLQLRGSWEAAEWGPKSRLSDAMRAQEWVDGGNEKLKFCVSKDLLFALVFT